MGVRQVNSLIGQFCVESHNRQMLVAGGVALSQAANYALAVGPAPLEGAHHQWCRLDLCVGRSHPGRGCAMLGE